MASQYFTSRRRRERGIRNELSDREKFADEIHIILKSLKKEIIAIIDLHKTWQDDATMHDVEKDYKVHAGIILANAEALGRDLQLPFPSVVKIKTLEQQVSHQATLRKIQDDNMVSLQNKLDSWSERYIALERQLAQNNREIERLTNRLDASNRDTTSLRREKQSSQRILDSNKKEITDLHEKYNRLKGTEPELTTLLEKKQYQKTQLQDLKIEWSKTNQQLTARKTNHTMRRWSSNYGLSSDLTALTRQKKKLETHIKNLEMNLTDTERQLTEHYIKRSGLVRKLSASEEELELLKQQELSIKRELKDLREKYDRCKEIDPEMTTLLDQSHCQRTDIQELELTLTDDNQRDNESVGKSQIQDLRLKLADTEQRLSELCERRTRPRDDLRVKANGFHDHTVEHDLADPNRPMKFADTMMDLYDNQWSTAMDNLTDLGIDDEQSAEILLKIFIELYRICNETNEKQLESILSGHSIVFPDTDGLSELSSHEQMERLNDEFERYLRNYRKVHCGIAGEYIAQVILKKKQILSDLEDAKIKACETFINDCAKFNWKMAVQDPPYHIEWNFRHGERFDRSKLRSYAKGGNCVDFVAWPVLYQYLGGPLLSKGIAQGLTSTDL